jgi:hypothetical protein
MLGFGLRFWRDFWKLCVLLPRIIVGLSKPHNKNMAVLLQTRKKPLHERVFLPIELYYKIELFTLKN